MVETDTVEGVEEGETALDFVGLDHALQHISDRYLLTRSGQMVGHGQDSTKIV